MALRWFLDRSELQARSGISWSNTWSVAISMQDEGEIVVNVPLDARVKQYDEIKRDFMLTEIQKDSTKERDMNLKKVLQGEKGLKGMSKVVKNKPDHKISQTSPTEWLSTASLVLTQQRKKNLKEELKKISIEGSDADEHPMGDLKPTQVIRVLSLARLIIVDYFFKENVGVKVVEGLIRHPSKIETMIEVVYQQHNWVNIKIIDGRKLSKAPTCVETPIGPFTLDKKIERPKMSGEQVFLYAPPGSGKTFCQLEIGGSWLDTDLFLKDVSLDEVKRCVTTVCLSNRVEWLGQFDSSWKRIAFINYSDHSRERFIQNCRNHPCARDWWQSLTNESYARVYLCATLDQRIALSHVVRRWIYHH